MTLTLTLTLTLALTLTLTLTQADFDDEHVVPHPDDPGPQPDAPSGGRGQQGGRRASSRTVVPAPPASNPHRHQREGLPVYEHRASLLNTINSNQVSRDPHTLHPRPYPHAHTSPTRWWSSRARRDAARALRYPNPNPNPNETGYGKTQVP